jgi:hypothetical protein
MCASTVTSVPSPTLGRRPMFIAILCTAESCAGASALASSCAHLHSSAALDPKP